ncbi:MAG TPA: hypothetical protein VMD31_01185 [Opitutaceae bacterium]|nr:hypothetical protein [Opitutaceae bacterium]
MKSLCLALALAAGATGAISLRAAEPAATLLPLYEKVSTALVADNLTAPRDSAQALAAAAKTAHQADVAAAAGAVAGAKDIAAGREALKALSRDAVVLARHERGWFIVNCPMADADWVQRTRQIANPYFGQSMPSCGTVTEETKG